MELKTQWIQLSRKTPSEAFGSIKPMTTGIQWRYNRRYVRYGQNKRRTTLVREDPVVLRKMHTNHVKAIGAPKKR